MIFKFANSQRNLMEKSLLTVRENCENETTEQTFEFFLFYFIFSFREYHKRREKNRFNQNIMKIILKKKNNIAYVHSFFISNDESELSGIVG
jgi:hypothetical protein